MTDWLIFTPAKRTSAKALNDSQTALEPRLVDNPAHSNFGLYVLQASILTANGYERFAPEIKVLAKVEAENDAVFVGAFVLTGRGGVPLTTKSNVEIARKVA